MRSRLDNFFLFLATCFYSSYLPPKIAVHAKATEWGRKYFKEGWTGAGIMGSIFGLITHILLPKNLGAIGSFIVILVGIAIAVYVSGKAEKVFGVHDDSRIVIDEWIGAMVAMVGIPLWSPLPHRFGFEILTAFIFFRIFDVFKGPWGRRLQNLPSGWGVVMDDVVAGLIANFFTRIVVVFVGVL